MKRMHLLFAVLWIVLIAASCKQTETTETTTASDTMATTDTSATTATAPVLNEVDKDFVESATRAGTAEVELGQDGVANARNAEVKAFAQKVVDDHTKANQELMQFATSRAMTIVGETEAKAKEAKARLLKLTGRSFDQAFVQQMIDDHTETVRMFEEEERNGTDADLKSWVSATLPVLREHLKMAQDLQKKIGKR